MSRIRQSNLFFNNRNMQGTTCLIPTETKLNEFKNDLNVLLSNETILNNAKNIAFSNFNPNQFCGAGQNVSNWLTKYPAIKLANLPLSKTTYCERNFLQESLSLLNMKLTTIANTIVVKKSQIASEETNLIQLTQLYNQCLQSEAQQLQALSVAQTTETNLTEARTTETQAQTEQVETIAQIQENTQENNFKKYLPYGIGAIVIIGAGYWYFTKNKKRK